MTSASATGYGRRRCDIQVCRAPILWARAVTGHDGPPRGTRHAASPGPDLVQGRILPPWIAWLVTSRHVGWTDASRRAGQPAARRVYAECRTCDTDHPECRANAHHVRGRGSVHPGSSVRVADGRSIYPDRDRPTGVNRSDAYAHWSSGRPYRSAHRGDCRNAECARTRATRRYSRCRTGGG